MIRKRHPSAPTDTATRREIQQREESDRAPVARLGRDQRTITEGPPSSINRLYVRGYYVVEALFVNLIAREYLPWNLDFAENQIDKPETWPSLSHREWKGNTQYYYDKGQNVHRRLNPAFAWFSALSSIHKTVVHKKFSPQFALLSPTCNFPPPDWY